MTHPGSGPMHLFTGLVPFVSVGCADFDARAHAPNESIPLDLWYRDMKRQAKIIELLGKDS